MQGVVQDLHCFLHPSLGEVPCHGALDLDCRDDDFRVGHPSLPPSLAARQEELGKIFLGGGGEEALGARHVVLEGLIALLELSALFSQCLQLLLVAAAVAVDVATAEGMTIGTQVLVLRGHQPSQSLLQSRDFRLLLQKLLPQLLP
jgi:hypothetical protein